MVDITKVYVITRGEYSDYGIERIFSNMEAAEKYCAMDNDKYESPMIEEWDLEDGSNIICPNLYKAIWFVERLYGFSFEILFSNKPFIRDIQKDRKDKSGCIPGMSGYIPITKEIENKEDVIEKIIRDNIAIWKAQQAGL